MPYTPLTGQALSEEADEEPVGTYREAAQERQVRLAAQRVLASHLRGGDESGQPNNTFWSNTDLDLAGATLLNFNLSGCTARTVDFESATFAGNATFQSTTFAGDANFNSATFTNEVDFQSATFNGDSQFRSTTFTGDAHFGARIPLHYQAVTFAGDADFRNVIFSSAAWFCAATFTGTAEFEKASFTREVSFSGANLPQVTYSGAVVTGAPGASGVVRPYSDFTGAQFEQRVPKEVAPFMASADSPSDA